MGVLSQGGVHCVDCTSHQFSQCPGVACPKGRSRRGNCEGCHRREECESMKCVGFQPRQPEAMPEAEIDNVENLLRDRVARLGLNPTGSMSPNILESVIELAENKGMKRLPDDPSVADTGRAWREGQPENPPTADAEATARETDGEPKEPGGEADIAARIASQRMCTTEEGARLLQSETGHPIWHCLNWGNWWCGPESSLPTWPTPGALRFDWIAEAATPETDGEPDGKPEPPTMRCPYCRLFVDGTCVKECEPLVKPCGEFRARVMDEEELLPQALRKCTSCAYQNYPEKCRTVVCPWFKNPPADEAEDMAPKTDKEVGVSDLYRVADTIAKFVCRPDSPTRVEETTRRIIAVCHRIIEARR